MITGQNGRVIDLSTRMYNMPFELLLYLCLLVKSREKKRARKGSFWKRARAKTNQTCKAIE